MSTRVISRAAKFVTHNGTLYRLDLVREFDRAVGPTIVFCPHNPSRAGADSEDATSRRMIDFSDRWGARKLIVVNPWAACATQPRDLWRLDDPVGPGNDEAIALAAREARETGGFVVVGWGAISPPKRLRAQAMRRLHDVAEIIEREGAPMRHLGLTRGGFPKHPLRLARSTPLNAWIDP